jgi:hypothetical protein
LCLGRYDCKDDRDDTHCADLSGQEANAYRNFYQSSPRLVEFTKDSYDDIDIYQGYVRQETHVDYSEQDQPLVINDNAAPSLLAPSEMIRIRL